MACWPVGVTSPRAPCRPLHHPAHSPPPRPRAACLPLQVMKDGRLQRFCQQCGRFHDLSAFDGNRKSCREQLNKHNARRRRRAQLEQQSAAAPEDLSAIADEKSEVGAGAWLWAGLCMPFGPPAQLHGVGCRWHRRTAGPAGAPAADSQRPRASRRAAGRPAAAGAAAEPGTAARIPRAAGPVHAPGTAAAAAAACRAHAAAGALWWRQPRARRRQRRRLGGRCWRRGGRAAGPARLRGRARDRGRPGPRLHLRLHPPAVPCAPRPATGRAACRRPLPARCCRRSLPAPAAAAARCRARASLRPATRASTAACASP